MIDVRYQRPVIMKSGLAVAPNCIRVLRFKGPLVSSFFSLRLFSLFLYATLRLYWMSCVKVCSCFARRL